uniref:Calcipressin-2 n=1 Tax=Magallana gigas TaxID=29159 RepID=A0A8W8JCX0_MAGGI
MADVDDAEDINAVLNDDNLSSPSHNEPGTDARENMYFHDLPDALIVTNIDECIFDDVKCKVEFESLFRKYDETASFLYLRSFRRARVNFSTPEMAATARIHLHELELYGKRVKCYFAQPKDEESENKDPHYLKSLSFYIHIYLYEHTQCMVGCGCLFYILHHVQFLFFFPFCFH